jgi:hypothetical protein
MKAVERASEWIKKQKERQSAPRQALNFTFKPVISTYTPANDKAPQGKGSSPDGKGSTPNMSFEDRLKLKEMERQEKLKKLADDIKNRFSFKPEITAYSGPPPAPSSGKGSENVHSLFFLFLLLSVSLILSPSPSFLSSRNPQATARQPRLQRNFQSPSGIVTMTTGPSEHKRNLKKFCLPNTRSSPTFLVTTVCMIACSLRHHLETFLLTSPFVFVSVLSRSSFC